MPKAANIGWGIRPRLSMWIVCGVFLGITAMPSMLFSQTTAIYLIDANGSNARPLVARDGWHLLTPSFMADTQRVLFCGWEFANSLEESQVLSVATNGKDEKAITAGYAPAWNPHAKLMAAQEYDKGVLVFESDGAGKELFAHNTGNPQWSPDGKLLAVLRWADNIQLIDVDTGKTWDLLLDKDNWVPLPGYSFSPDGSKICFVGRRSRSFDSYGVLTVDVAPIGDFATERESEKRQLTLLYAGAANGGTTWSPDGKSIAFSLASNSDPPQIYLLDTDKEDQTPRRLSDQPQDRWNVHPCWSPDGRQIVFSSYLNMPPGSAQIQAMPTDLPQEPSGRINIRPE